ncbi:MAG: D-glycero-beta-D-manno-heptose 1,7-bisphosphate 7-phosphatase [Verrucomicrobia bacterium]|nr:D-glycero-beta-D-manno-heptose 1,7-bisphosphate 7-phosphatase [Verrucomicrobiota bacterium]
MSKAGRKAFFLDRDGVINVDRGYVSKVDDFIFMDGVFPVLRALSAKGYALIIVTNQSGIGRGYYTAEDFQVLTDWMLRKLEAEGIEIAGIYSCPHSPEVNCHCRKPAPGMLLQAIREHGIDPAVSWMVGDKPSDMAAAEAAGIRNRVLLGRELSGHCTHMISTLRELAGLLE